MTVAKKYLPLALLLGFLLFGLDAFMQSRPTPKSPRIYKAIQRYSPYYLEKRFGGLQIMSREESDFKEKPTNMTLFKEFERLERVWGKEHLKVDQNQLLILDNNGSLQTTLPLESQEEITFVHHYYGI